MKALLIAVFLYLATTFMSAEAHLQLTLDLNQRWTGGRASYRPPAETIRTSEYEVAEIPDDTTSKKFVLSHHYSRTYPAARFRIGLYRHGRLVGVSVFSHPVSDKVITNVFPIPPIHAVELGRFVLDDSVPGNGESWFLARAFEILRSKDIAGVVSFSDPMPRKSGSGDLIFPGHYGCIYQASGGVYLGRGTARRLRLLHNGQVLSDRTIQKIRKGERGWRYAASILEDFGASPAPSAEDDRRCWLQTWLESLTISIHHRGNHKYAWPLRRDMRPVLPASLPYPKYTDAVAHT